MAVRYWNTHFYHAYVKAIDRLYFWCTIALSDAMFFYYCTFHLYIGLLLSQINCKCSIDIDVSVVLVLVVFIGCTVPKLRLGSSYKIFTVSSGCQ